MIEDEEQIEEELGGGMEIRVGSGPEDEADELIETPLGAYSTRAFVQERDGSSRQTFIWAAPDLNHLPLRIEQKRNGETRMVFLLESVDWVSAPTE